MRSSHGEGLERDYKLRSHGSTTLSVEALDNLVSGRSSPTRSSPPPFPSTSTTMAEPTIKDLMELMKSFQTELSSVKADMATMKDKSSSPSDDGGGGCEEPPREFDRPQDSRSSTSPASMARPIQCSSSTNENPIFTNSAPCRRSACRWPPTIWRTSRSCGTSGCRKTRECRHGDDSRTSSTFVSGHLSARCPSSSCQSVAALGPWRNTPTGFRLCCHTRVGSTRANMSNSTPAAFFHR
jgi:hypothetical protein